jgi:hypothetical protein
VSTISTSEKLPLRNLELNTSRDVSLFAGAGGVEGYTVHPAATDCSLHLGAVAAGTDKGPSRVPVGLGAYTAESAGLSLIHLRKSAPLRCAEI